MRVSNLSFGASSLGGVFHGIREEEGIRAVHTAVDNGINFIDVSPYYGHLKAEMVLGKALKEIPREKYYLSTKVGRYGKDGVNTWVMNIVLGLFGGALGGWLFSMLGIEWGGVLGQLGTAIIGAVAILWIASFFKK